MAMSTLTFSVVSIISLSSLSPCPHSQLVIEMVLGTDMKSHFSIISHFSTVHRLGSNANVPSSIQSMVMPRRSGSVASGCSSQASGMAGGGYSNQVRRGSSVSCQCWEGKCLCNPSPTSPHQIAHTLQPSLPR